MEGNETQSCPTPVCCRSTEIRHRNKQLSAKVERGWWPKKSGAEVLLNRNHWAHLKCAELGTRGKWRSLEQGGTSQALQNPGEMHVGGVGMRELLSLWGALGHKHAKAPSGLSLPQGQCVPGNDRVLQLVCIYWTDGVWSFREESPSISEQGKQCYHLVCNLPPDVQNALCFMDVQTFLSGQPHGRLVHLALPPTHNPTSAQFCKVTCLSANLTFFSFRAC